MTSTYIYLYLAECKEAFSTFDTTGAGQISTDHLGQLLKIMGHSPTPDEIKNILEEVDEDGKKSGFSMYLVIAQTS